MSFNVNTKFNIGDTVYYLSNNKVQKATIEGVIIVYNENGKIRILYRVDERSKFEEELYVTQEKLIDAIMYEE